MKTSIYAGLIAIVGITTLQGCSMPIPFERPAYEITAAEYYAPAAGVPGNTLRQAFLWSEGNPVSERHTHGGTHYFAIEEETYDGPEGLETRLVTVGHWQPDGDLTEAATRLGIDGRDIGQRALTHLDPERLFVTWQEGSDRILGEFRDSVLLGRLGSSLVIASDDLLLSDTVVADPIYRGVPASHVEGRQYDVAYEALTGRLLAVWRQRARDGSAEIAYRFIDTGSEGRMEAIRTVDLPGLPAGSDNSWPEISSGIIDGRDTKVGFCLTFINNDPSLPLGRQNAVYAVLIESSTDTITGPFLVTATPDNLSGRGDFQRATSLFRTGGMGRAGFEVVYDSPDGIKSRKLSEGDLRLSDEIRELTVGRQGMRNTPILVAHNPARNKYALVYYEQEATTCVCQGEPDCACEGYTRERSVLYGQRLNERFAPDRVDGEVQRKRIGPPLRAIRNPDLPPECSGPTPPDDCRYYVTDIPRITIHADRRSGSGVGEVHMRYSAAGKASLIAESIPRISYTEHQFGILRITESDGSVREGENLVWDETKVKIKKPFRWE